MTLNEYLIEKNKIYKKVYEILKDDTSADVVYELQLLERASENKAICCGIFKKFANLEEEISNQTEGMSWPDDDGNFDDDYCEEDYSWFVVDKYCLIDGEYKNELRCRLTFDKKLLDFLPFDDELKKLQMPSCKNVIKAYDTGDVLKVKNKPLTDDFYVIYIYDENREGHKHIQICFNLEECEDEFAFCKIHSLELTEKVDTCPDDRINEMSKKIKENPEEISKLLELYKVKPYVHPMRFW